MTDWQVKPAVSDQYTDIFTDIRAKFSALMRGDYTGFTNIETGAIRYNVSSSQHERYNGSSWVALPIHTTLAAHIADTTIHQTGHIGSMEFVGYSSPDTNYLACDGTAYSRSTYAALFAKIGTSYGVGDGSSTFNVPNLQGKIAIGVSSGISAINAAGKTAGSWDHTHTTPNHQHTIATHSHGMTHTHQIGGHSHTINSFTLTVPAHYHATTGNGADVNILSSGAHQHDIPRRQTAGSATADGRVVSTNGSGAAENGGITVSNSTSNHTHSNATFNGRVGNVNSGNDGDAGVMTTGASGTLTSNANSDFTSGAASVSTTDGSGTLTSNTGEGGGTSGTSNPPVLAGYWQIRYAY